MVGELIRGADHCSMLARSTHDPMLAAAYLNLAAEFRRAAANRLTAAAIDQR
jgi:hypothetical protein